MNLRSGEFILTDWANEGLNVETAVKRGVYSIHESLVLKRLGILSDTDSEKLTGSLQEWFGI
jgi:mRNA interferase MazF